MVDHLGAVGYPVGFLICAPEVPEGFEVPVIHAKLPVSPGKELGMKIVVAAGRKMPDGHAALAVCFGHEKQKQRTGQDGRR